MKLVSIIIATFIIFGNAVFAQWVEQYYNFNVHFSSVFMNDENNGFTVGYTTDQTTGVIYGTTNGGQSWFNVPGQGNKLYSVWFCEENIGFAVGSYGTIVKTTDGGGYWFELNSGTTSSLYAVRFINSNTGFVAGGHNTNGAIILKTTDQGVSWTEKPCSELGVLRDLYFINSEIGWAVGSQQLGSPPNLTDRAIMLKTTDGGESWDFINNGISDCQIRAIAFMNDNVGWAAGTKNYNSTPLVVIIKTTNGGTNWISLISNKLGAMSNLRMCDASRGWAVGIGDVWGNQYGLNYETTDGGNTWIHKTALNNIKMGDLFFLNPYIGWGTARNRIYKYETTSNADEENDISFNYSLDQNYPNPFNPSTKIKYSVPQTSQVQIKVFDVLGNEIETLVNEEKSIGNYELTWYAENLPNGIYFYRIQAGSFIDTKKMILLK